MEFRIRIALSGAPNSATLTVIYIPTGLTIDTSFLTSSSSNGTVPLAAGVTMSAGNLYDAIAVYSSSTQIAPEVKSAGATYTGAGSNITQAVPATYANGDSIELVGSIPITGWR